MDLLALSKFQQSFKRKRLLHCFLNKPFTLLFNDIEKLMIGKTENDFIRIRNHIQKDIVVKITSIFLDRLYRFLNTTHSEPVDIIAPRLSAKDFLVACIIKSHPMYTFCTNNYDPLQRDLMELSSNMINNINIMMKKNEDHGEYLRKFIKSVNLYSNCFNQYMALDKKRSIGQLIHKWADDQKMIDGIRKSDKYSDDDRTNVIDTIKRQQDRTRHIISMYGSKLTDDILMEYYNMISDIDTMMRSAYWDIIKNNIVEKKYDMLVKLFEEIQEKIISSVPNNHTFHERFTDIFDAKFIEQLIKHTEFGETQVVSYAEYIICTLEELHAPDRIQVMKKDWDNIRTSTYGVDQIVNILRFIIDQVGLLERDLYLFNNIMVLMDEDKS
jgi:hypothetical protein